MSYAVLELDTRLAAALRLPMRRFPVSKDTLGEIVGPRGFRLDRLVDEVDLIAADLEEDEQSRIGPAIARLAVVVAYDLDRLGQTERALHYAVLAQLWAPGHPEAIALVALLSHGTADYATAVEHYARLLELDPDGAWVGLRSIAARAATAAGDHGLALELLEPAADPRRESGAFWALMARVRAEADLAAGSAPTVVVPPTGVDRKAAPRTDAPNRPRLDPGRVLAVESRRDGWLEVRDVEGERGFVLEADLR